MEQTMILQFLYNEAYTAYLGTSMVPDERAKGVVSDYSQQLEADLVLIEDVEAKERYKHKYIQMLRNWLHAKSRCLSTMIAGPSNFPVRRAEKANRSEHNRSVEFTEWRGRALAAINRVEKKAVNPLEDAQSRLKARQDAQETMKKANAVIRKGKDVEKLLSELGIKDSVIAAILNPSYGPKGFPAYALTNNLAEIKRLGVRVKELETKQEAGIGGNKEFAFGPVTLVHNFEANRVQLLFPGKPSEEVRTYIKRNGFKWSPSNMAWQRIMTPNAVAVATRAAKELEGMIAAAA